MTKSNVKNLYVYVDVLTDFHIFQNLQTLMEKMLEMMEGGKDVRSGDWANKEVGFLKK